MHQLSAPITIIHLITGVNAGGAQMMLAKLLTTIDSKKFSNHVISLTSLGPVGDIINRSGIPTYALGMQAGLFNLKGFYTLWRLMREIKPSIMQTWLYHSDLVGLVFGKLSGVSKICWNIRCTNMEMEKYPLSSQLALRLCSHLSPMPSCIVCNSNEAISYHKKLGYRNRNWRFIPNGFDLEKFKPDVSLRKRKRQELGLNEDAICIGRIARFDPMKDFQSLIMSALQIKKRNSNVSFVLCGANVDWQNEKLANMITEYGLTDKFVLLGQRNDISEIMCCLDIMVSSSAFGESFPNVIGEAMACGLPCVATDVGECANIIDGTGLVVPPKNPTALSDAVNKLIDSGFEKRRELGFKAANRIREFYSIDKIVTEYEKLYLSILSPDR